MSDEPWGILALITAIFFLIRKGEITKKVNHIPLIFSCTLVCIYCILYTSLPPLVRAVLAILSVSCTLSSFYLGKNLRLSILGLLILSLPIIASLQFYAGYPVRFLTSNIASALISATGYEVQAQGTILHWMGEVVAVDAPCSGIKMLWSGLYLSLSLSCIHEIGSLYTWLGYTLSVFIIFIGNVVRATLLFYSESGIVILPDWTHQGIGVVIFFFVALAIFILMEQISRKKVCE